MSDIDRSREWMAHGRVAWTRRASWLSLFVERVWPLVLGLACLAAIFLILSWFGLFAAMPYLARMLVLGVLGLLALAVLWANRRIRVPRRAEVDRRIELVSRLQHQPLRVQGEQATGEDPFALALWREHQRRMAERLRHLSGGSPNTQTERLDPLGMRALIALLLVTAFAFSFGAGGGRLGDAFAPDDSAPAASRRIDAWVTPPTYTGRAPIFLTDAQQSGTVAVPQGSVLSVRISDGSGAGLAFTPKRKGAEAVNVASKDEAAAQKAAAASGGPGTAGGASQAEKSAASKPAASANGPREYAYTLRESGAAALTTAFQTLGQWSFAVTPDTDPKIAFKGEPKEARNGALELAYTVTDDYGVAKGRAEIAVEDKTVAPGARPLFPPPEVRLALPRRTRGTAEARTSADLTESPYAGAKVGLTLVAEDDAGQAGRSATKHITLPERRFTNPLARAVVEQRRMLALNANAAPRVVDMLDAITLRGDEFIKNPGDYIALKAVRTRIATAHDDAALKSAVDFMWEIALGIEDGNLSLAEKRLRDAREKLSQALQNGASNEEIDRLMKDLRQAMNDYLQELAQQMKNQPPMSQDQMQMGNAQEIRQQDLEKMMNQIENLAKSGSKEAAQQLLSQLQQMMDNLQAMRPGRPQQGQPNAMQQQMNKLGELLQKQQQLRDQTYDLGRQRAQQQGQEGQQGQQQPGQQPGQPMTAEQMQKMLQQMQQQQGQLQKDLQALQQQLQGMGMQPSKGFGEADQAMGDAKGALGKGNDGEAVGQQGKALEALRSGAKDMMQQMQQAMQQGQGQPGQMGQGFPGQPNPSGRDPLGRQMQTQGPDFGQDVKVPDEIDTQRARRILDEIRNRLGDQLSPQLERQYLERLLKTP
ncbi:TIGR02302 family protein [Jiella sp. M17.18]|uniref:TIGR02302 family protein n=1 Tax=Jiella sp. M17.18 TaxID=3234247 RepID=UPI0034DF9836